MEYSVKRHAWDDRGDRRFDDGQMECETVNPLHPFSVGGWLIARFASPEGKQRLESDD